MILSSYFIHLLCILTKIENTFFIQQRVFKKIKIFLLKHMIYTDPHFTNTDISNILCIKPIHNDNFKKSLEKIIEKPMPDIFRISPRAIVSCVLNNNIELLRHIQYMGYPLETIVCADNFELVKKRKMMHILYELDVKP